MTPENDTERYWRELQKAVDEHLATTDNAHLAHLGREYVEAMRGGARLRELAEEKPYSELKSGRIVSNPLWEAADREVRRGIQIAKALELHKPAPRRERDPFAGLDAGRTPASLAAQREKRASSKRKRVNRKRKSEPNGI